MKVEEHIQDEIRHRLETHRSLVVYDAEGRYRDLTFDLADEKTTVVDTSAGVIESREAAFTVWLDLDQKPDRRLIIYRPTEAPRGDRERLEDPYLIFSAEKGYFPNDVNDEYQNLCRAAFPDQGDQIEQLFTGGSPSFDEVNALHAGSTWPKLSTLLGADSAAEITIALLACEPAAADAFDADKAALDEGRRFLATQPGLTLPNALKTIEALRSSLWRFLLFSEFVFDLPIPLPAALETVARASDSRREFVLRVCEQLRTSTAAEFKAQYADRAASIEEELDLVSLFQGEADLGKIETFPFEDISAFHRFCNAFVKGNVEETKSVLEEDPGSLWRTNVPLHAEVWHFAELAHRVVFTALDDVAPKLAAMGKPTIGDLLAQYETSFSALDAAFRNFHQALSRMGTVEFYGIALHPIVERVNEVYRDYSDRIHAQFVSAAEKAGWPIPGRPRHSAVFERAVKPSLESSERIAYVMVDALRFELGLELQRSLTTGFEVTLESVAAQLPSKTEAGMAALLPAAAKLELGGENGNLTVQIDSTDVTGAAKRDSFFKERYGDRVWTIGLEELTSLPQKYKVPESVQLAVVRTNAIDSAGEKDAALLASAIPALLRQLERGIRRLAQLGFQRIVVATDHGFYYFPEREVGDACSAPAGDWIVAKDRFLLGKGSESPSTITFVPGSVGIRSTAEAICFPRDLTTFQAGVRYFHGGLSLPECVLPLLTLKPIEKGARKKPTGHVSLLFKGKDSGTVYNRVFMVDISSPQSEASMLFDDLDDPLRLEIDLSVTDEKGTKSVGRVAECQWLNPTTGRIEILPGKSLRVPIRIDEEYHGSIRVRATDAATGIQHGKISLETDFME